MPRPGREDFLTNFMNITAERYALLLNQTTERPTTKHTEKPPTNNYKTLYSSMIQAVQAADKTAASLVISEYSRSGAGSALLQSTVCCGLIYYKVGKWASGPQW